MENKSSVNACYAYFHPVQFKGLIRTGKNGNPLDSAFFRDYDALIKTVETLQKNFPNGAQILDYACSDGEEAISIFALLGKDTDKFKITGYDIDDTEALKLAHQGIYSVFHNNLDSFLIDNSGNNLVEKYLSVLFDIIMESAEEPNEPLNNSPKFLKRNSNGKLEPREQIFFKPNHKIKENIDFKVGDIFNIDKEPVNGKVGAIFFRNASFQLMDTFDGDTILKKPYNSSKTFDEKQQIADEIVDKIYNKLETGGVFVIGNSVNENIFLAPPNTSDKDMIKFKDTKIFKKEKECMEKDLYAYRYLQFLVDSKEEYENIMTSLQQALNKYIKMGDKGILKKTPMHTALEKDGRFIPIHYSKMDVFDEIEVPTVWMKVK